MGGLLFARVYSDRTSGNGLQLKKERIGTGCPEKLYVPHPRNILRPGYWGPEQPELVGVINAHGGGIGAR